MARAPLAQRRGQVPAVVLALLALPALSGCFGAGEHRQPEAGAPDTPRLPWADDEFRTDGTFSYVAEPGPYKILADEDAELASEIDGATIQIGYVRPDTSEQVPVIAMATWYLADQSQATVRDACGDLRNERRGMCAMDAAFLVDNFVPHGYAVAIIVIRGTGGSGGCHGFGTPAEVCDLSQAVTWLGTQSWSTGKVGMTGISYGGTTPWMVASTGNQHLTTIVPAEGAPNLHWHVVRNGTSIAVPPAAWFQQGNLGYSYGVLQPHNPAAADERVCPEKAEFLSAVAMLEVDAYADLTGFWALRDWRAGVLANYHGSALVVTGFRDNLYPGASEPWTEDLKAAGLNVHELWGRWNHAVPDQPPGSPYEAAMGPLNPTPRWDWAEMLLRWFDRELKGLDVEVGPPAQVADNLGQWRVEEAWPPTDVEWLGLDLADFTLTTPSPAAAGISGVGTRGAVLRHPGFDHDVRIAGQPRLVIDVTPTGPKSVMAVWMRDAQAASLTEEFGYAVMDLRYRKGPDAELVTPGQPVAVPLEFLPLDGYLPAGHPLELVIDTAYGVPTGASVTPVIVEAAGTLWLPTIERPETAFFDPPGT